jgi:hypothetical protein
MKIAHIYALLKAQRIVEAISCAREWSKTASYADIEIAVAECPANYRRRMVSMLRDVLSGYPRVQFGAPVLIRYEPQDPAAGPLRLTLPDVSPDDSVGAIAWLSLDNVAADVPLSAPSLIDIAPHKTTVAVLLLRTSGEETPVISDSWWGDLFSETGAEPITISSNIVAPLPDAIEAGRVLLGAATHHSAPDFSQMFLSDHDYIRALSAGGEWVQMLSARHC